MNVRARTIEARDGTRLNCWERVPDEASEAVVFVHGSITNGRALFATSVADDDSYSWLHAAAEMGRAAYALDVRGYGGSDLPPELGEEPAAIDVPTLVIRGTEDVLADRPGSLDHFDELTVDTADYVELDGADHYLMHGDRRRDCFEIVDGFQDRVHCGVTTSSG